jgi:hypothetical protein
VNEISILIGVEPGYRQTWIALDSRRARWQLEEDEIQARQRALEDTHDRASQADEDTRRPELPAQP